MTLINPDLYAQRAPETPRPVTRAINCILAIGSTITVLLFIGLCTTAVIS
ncbi:hypothetical protein [Corynebacterium qintianiae]|nr:hypothetical protein [Corynebacterium qintianiae]